MNRPNSIERALGPFHSIHCPVYEHDPYKPMPEVWSEGCTCLRPTLVGADDGLVFFRGLGWALLFSSGFGVAIFLIALGIYAVVGP